ncbi:MAG: hypothetical protein HQL74_11540 [Magnetococcales bacterium]|nr:hypothetical protein [Magnetococcales bacterium]
MPPRATLAKLKKQMDAPNRSNAKADDPPEFSQSDKLSAMEKRFIAMELRLEEMAKMASAPLPEPVAVQSPEMDDRVRAMEQRLEEMARMASAPPPEPVVVQSPVTDDRVRAMEQRLEEMARMASAPPPEPVVVQSSVTDDRVRAMEQRLEELTRVVATPTPVPSDPPTIVTPLVDEGRIQAMERRIEALSRTVATLPTQQVLQPITKAPTLEPPMLFFPAVYGVKMTEMMIRWWLSPMLFLSFMRQPSSNRDGR